MGRDGPKQKWRGRITAIIRPIPIGNKKKAPSFPIAEHLFKATKSWPALTFSPRRINH
jgi:hypothetical protein